LIADAERRVRSRAARQHRRPDGFSGDLFNLKPRRWDPGLEAAHQETRGRSTCSTGAFTDLAPASAYIRRLQHQLARQANLVSHSYGKEPHRRVRIFRE
jgi:hypothetical protein